MANPSYSNAYFRFKGLVNQTYPSLMTHFKTTEVHMKEVKDVAFQNGFIKTEDDGMTRHL